MECFQTPSFTYSAYVINCTKDKVCYLKFTKHQRNIKISVLNKMNVLSEAALEKIAKDELGEDKTRKKVAFFIQNNIYFINPCFRMI